MFRGWCQIVTSRVDESSTHYSNHRANARAFQSLGSLLCWGLGVFVLESIALHAVDLSPMKTTNTLETASKPARHASRFLPALPAGWRIDGEWLIDPTDYARHIHDTNGRIDRMKVANHLDGYAHTAHAHAWRMGADANADLLAALQAIATQAELTARTFPNAPGRGDWVTVERIAREAIARATAATTGEKGGAGK